MPRKKQRRNRSLNPPPKVAVLVDTSTDWSRRIISGIMSYLNKHNPWQLFIEPHGLGEHLDLQKGWHGDGVIARVTHEKLLHNLRARNIPVVNVSGIMVPGPQFPCVTSDTKAIAKMAVDYFKERGFRHFAYLSLQGLEYVSRQREAFIAEVQRNGYRCNLHAVKSHLDAQAPDWGLRIESLAKWLRTLPKPVAIMTWSGGREMVHACQFASLNIPEDVALLSGTDDLLCEASHVPISAVRAASERIGYEAAEMLDKLMSKRAVEETVRLIPPLRVVSRQSTDVVTIQDSALAKALKFIRDNAERPINVGEVAERAGIHRRLLERRFKDVLGRSPAEHIRRVHIELAKKMLIDTDMSIADVAEKSGFGSAEYMASLFHNELKITPLRYRRENTLGLS